jgi:hypothetical protein
VKRECCEKLSSREWAQITSKRPTVRRIPPPQPKKKPDEERRAMPGGIKKVEGAVQKAA